VQGASGCEADGDRAFAPAPGRWAAVAGAGRVLANAGRLVGEAGGAGARVLVVADREGPRGRRAAALLAASGARVARLDLSDPARAEAAVRAVTAPGGPPVALVALSPCTRGAPRRPPLGVAASRCNRCGACLSLGCPALSDVGGEAMAIDPGICTGCAACAALCRARAISPE
jgi:ferredoxin